jgi:hypothetical protein
MGKVHGIAGPGRRRDAFLIYGMLAFFAGAAILSRGQDEIPPAPSPTVSAATPGSTEQEPKPSPPVKERFLVDRFPTEPSLPPALTLPIEPLGFTAPSSNYMGARNSMASLDFLDENRLLFTFRIPGLLHRDQLNRGDSDERQIRAVVLSLPKGTVEAETTWTVHDRVRYLWPLNDGHFLLRDRNGLSEGDRTLALKPYLDFPGPLLSIELDPEQHFLVTNSEEPAARNSKSGELAGSANASTADASDQDSDPPNLVIRILRRESGEVMLVSRVRIAVHLPIDSAGYLENLRSHGMEWILNFNYFSGGTKMLGHVESTCEPDDEFLSDQEILATTCGPLGESSLVAMTTAGKTLWETKAPPTEVWPQLVVAGNGLRMAWETLDTTHAIYAYAPMDAGEVREQSVTIFDAANGDIAMVSPVSPILDAGGNVTVSPTGRRVALLNAGAIQVFDLPAPPPVHIANGLP